MLIKYFRQFTEISNYKNLVRLSLEILTIYISLHTKNDVNRVCSQFHIYLLISLIKCNHHSSYLVCHYVGQLAPVWIGHFDRWQSRYRRT